MSERFDDDRLETVLRSLGRHLETGDVSADDASRLATVTPLPARVLRRSTRWLVAAAALLVAVVLVGVLTPAGETVAHWFGIGTVKVTVVLPEEMPTIPTERIFSDAVDALEPSTAWAEAGLDPTTFDGTRLGAPDEFGRPPEGGVLFGWTASDTTLWVRDGADPFAGKKVADEGDVRPVPGLGDYALFIDGAHVLETPSRTLRGDRVLWWIDRGHEYRLESTFDRGAMIDIARVVE